MSLTAARSFGEKDEEELGVVLTKAGLLHLKGNFIQEKVCVKIIQFLDTKDWDRLGVSAIGDRIILVQLSKAYARDESASSKEIKDVFGTSSGNSLSMPSCSRTSSDSFADRAQKLCSNVLSRVSREPRRRKRSTPTHRVKEWTKNVVLIDYQSAKKHLPQPLYDYQKLFDGPIRLLSDMIEDDVRDEICRLVRLKNIPTHALGEIVPESFEFVKVYNRRVRQVDGDIPCDGNGLSHIYRSGSIYVRLKDTLLWVGEKVMEEDENDDHILPPVDLNGSATKGSENQSGNYSAFVNLISDSDTDDEDVRRALQESLMPQNSVRRAVVTNSNLSEIIKSHVAAQVSSELDNQQEVVIRRNAIWKTTLRCFRQLSFDCSRGLSVTFLGEPAVDAGGPLREFFRLLIKDIRDNGSLMCGPDHCRTAVHNAHALQTEEFVYVGQSIALSLLFGGPGPHFFSDAAANYLLGLPIEKIPFEELPDHEVAQKIKQIENCENTECLRKLLDSDDFIFRFNFGCGVPSSAVSIDDKERLLQCIAMHLTIYSQKAELDQIREGFKVLNFEEIVKLHPYLLKPLFISGRPNLTANDLLMFKVNWSVQGSNRRAKEEEIILNWNYYVKELEGGLKFEKFDGGTPIELSLGDLFSFVTGANHPPPLGFNEIPQVDFIEDPNRAFPYASTCSLTINLPLHLDAYTDFKQKMNEAMVAGHGFGTV